MKVLEFRYPQARRDPNRSTISLKRFSSVENFIDLLKKDKSECRRGKKYN